MCGICGILTPTGMAETDSIVQTMCDAIHHRGPDGEGIYHDPQLTMGMRRLSIIDLNTGSQPIFNEDKSVVIIFNGEIYNHKTLREFLEKRGHRFSTVSDTEVILHLYEEQGVSCVNELRGMFAFAIWDTKTQTLFLARDRLGIKPLYYASMGQDFFFASELKSLLATGLIPRRLNFSALHLYLSFYAVPAPFTMLEQVSALPAGHAILVKNGQPLIYQYWDVNFNSQPDIEKMSLSELTEETRRLLAESVQIRLMSDVPLGAFLSGGIDSGAVVALMSQMSSDPVKTFSIGFGDEGKRIDESSQAKLTSAYFQTDHTEHTVRGQDLLNNLDHFIYSLDQPSGDAVNTYFVSKIARTKVTVALSGLGGDELFAGYPHFRMLNNFHHPPHTGLGLKAKTARKISRFLPRRILRRKPFDNLLYSGLASSSFTDRYLELSRTLYDEKTKLRLYHPEWRTQALGLTEEAQTYLARFMLPASAHPVNQVSRLEFKNYMANTLLRDTDVMSMAHSLEVRVPLIDHKLVEFVAAIPPQYKLNESGPKFLLVEAIKDLLPPDIFYRRKRGFELPMHNWLKKDLKPVVDEVLSKESLKRRGIFDFQAISKLRQFNWVHGIYMRVWALVVLELWLRRYVDQP